MSCCADDLYWRSIWRAARIKSLASWCLKHDIGHITTRCINAIADYNGGTAAWHLFAIHHRREFSKICTNWSDSFPFCDINDQ